MQTIEFKTPALNKKGEIVQWTDHTARQSKVDMGSDHHLDMLPIPGGAYQMGSPHHTGDSDERPQHLVTIRSLMMSKFLITQGQWKAILRKLPPCRFKGDQLPVRTRIVEGCTKVLQASFREIGQEFRLPGESQWEYACRAGTGTPFSFGETLTVEVANFNGEHIFGEEPAAFIDTSRTKAGLSPECIWFVRYAWQSMGMVR